VLVLRRLRLRSKM